MNYRLLESTDPDDLSRQVEQLIQEGWKPQGGIALALGAKPDSEADCYYYFQAMINSNASKQERAESRTSSQSCPVASQGGYGEAGTRRISE